MTEENGPPGKIRYRWPWFILAAVVLGVVLFAVFVTVEARRVRQMRDSNSWTPSARPSEIPGAKETSRSTNDLLAGFRDVLSGGNADAGRKIFFEKPDVSCAKCHRIGGQGGDIGPALDNIGSQRPREFILEAVLYPNLHVNTNFETVIIILKNGQGFSGTLRGEDAGTVTVQTQEQGLLTVKKDDIQSRQKGLSPMPPRLGRLLSHDDLRNLIEFVARQRN
jgi:quinoprotein glucose dehydrogenase